MDRSELVISLCLENDHTFKHMKIYEIRNALLVSKMFGKNKRIIQQRNRYQVYTWHTRFNWNLIQLCDARQNKIYENIVKYEELQKKLLYKVYKTSIEIQDCFFRLMIATYKKTIYSYFNRASNLLDLKPYHILKEYDKIFEQNQELKSMIGNKHDHMHYIFVWGLFNYELINEEQMLEKWRKLNESSIINQLPIYVLNH